LALRRLEIINDRLNEADELPKLPSSLKYLYIKDVPMADLAWLPPMVETLDATRTGIPIKKLPASLRDLRYRFYPFENADFGTVADLHEDLHSLNLEGSTQLTSLEGLRSKLQSLDVSETSLSVLPLLPSTLTELDISNTRITSIKTLKSLTPQLRKLTIHAGQLTSLAGLPESVTELRFVPEGVGHE